MKFFVYVLSMLLMGCASLPQYKGASKVSSVIGEGKYDDIRMDLTRAPLDGIVNQTGSYFAKAFPLTKALVTSQLSEQCVKNFDQDSVCKKRINQGLKELEGESCLFVELQASSINAAKANLWKFKIEQVEGVYVEGKASGFNVIPSYLGPGPSRSWHNSGIVCFKPQIDYMKAFKLHIIPQFGGSDSKAILLIWETPKADKLVEAGR